MKRENDEYLCKTYPKIFVDRNAGMMTTTAMCWGFNCGDGWFNIIDHLCYLIQQHVDNMNERNVRMEEFNQMIESCKIGDWTKFDEYYKNFKPEFIELRKTTILTEEPRELDLVVGQVVATQVKEKYGTLRFYTNGSDDYVIGLIDMAESLSGVTCEDCGSHAKTSGGGWVYTRCDNCIGDKA